MVKNPPANVGDIRDPRVHSIPGLGRFPQKRAWQPTPVFLPGASHGQRSLVGHGPQGCRELDTTEANKHAGTQVDTRSKNCIQLALHPRKLQANKFKMKMGGFKLKRGKSSSEQI